MAFASIGTLGGGGFKANQTTVTLTLAAAAEAGNVIVLIIGLNNVNPNDSAGQFVSSVTSSVLPNGFTFAQQATSAEATDAGASVSVWFCNVQTTIGIGGTITATFLGTRGAGAITAWEFSKGAGTIATLVGKNTNVGAASALLSVSLDLTTPNENLIRFRAGAGEEESVTTGTKTAAFTELIGVTGTSGTGGLATSNIILRGEYLISTATSAASAPTGMPTCDWASVYIALREEPDLPERNIPDVVFNRIAMVPY